ELRPVKKEARVEERGNALPMEPVADSVQDGLAKTRLEQQEGSRAFDQPASAAAQNGFVQAVPPEPATELAAAERPSAAAAGSTTGTFDFTTTTTDAATETLGEKNLEVEDERAADAVTPTAVPHQVTREELVRNETVANATGRTREVAKRKAEAYKDVSASSRSLGADPLLLSLINSGW
ncbi:MAG TPA: hypothetical protein VKG92_03140, partial [Flavobacteriales bacterium]|nr:hypothetical protein [Flavobacteriales bacterium]